MQKPSEPKDVTAVAAPNEPTNRRRPIPFRLTSGFEILDQWSADAAQVEKNIVHEVLFALAEKSAFANYDVVDDVTKTLEFFVLAGGELAVKVRVHGLDSFGIAYVGPTCDAPGLDQAAPEATSSWPAAAVDTEGSPL
jgi:hypothetical protein